MSDKHWILGVHVADRMAHAGGVQDVLSRFGCNIKTRLGLHEVDEKHCSTAGLIILELFGAEDLCARMRDELRAIKGIEVQEMIFDHL